MTDANKYYLDKREAEQEEYDFKDEYEEIAADNVRLEAEVKKYHDAWLEAEAQVVDLEAQVEGCLAVIATERAEVLALRRKLAKAVEALDEAVYLLAPSEKDMMRQAGVYRIVTTLAELKGEQDDPT